MPSNRIARLSAAFAIAFALAGQPDCALAAELGEPVVRSYIGQPLVADIELGMLADPGASITVRHAHPDVYRGANIGQHPILASLNLSVMKRDGRQFLHITSLKPVDSEYVNLFLELLDGGKRNVRGVTLWLAPDPTPAPPPPIRPPEPQPKPPSPPAAEAVAAPKPRIRELNLSGPAPAACPQPSADQAKACAALDYQNGLLSAQIVELEEKVKLLQAAVEGKDKPAPKAAPAAAKPSVPPPPAKPAPVKKKSGFPWLLVAAIAGGLAVLGGAAFFVFSRKKAKAKSAETAAADSAAWYARLAARFKRKPKADAAPAPEEPKLE